MTNFLVLYRSSVSAAEQMAAGTPEQTQAGIEAWMAWAQKAAGAIVDLGSPVAPTTTVGDQQERQHSAKDFPNTAINVPLARR
jgi:hypothetical protein